MRPQLSSLKLAVNMIVFMIAALWVVPFCLPVHAYPMGTFWQEWTSVLIIGAIAITMFHQSQPAEPISVPKIVLAPLGLGVVIGIQFLRGQFDFEVQLTLPAIYLILAIFSCVIGKTLAERGQLEDVSLGIAAACVVGGLFSVAVQIAQFAAVEQRLSFMSPRLAGYGLYANLNQVNHLAAYLAMALVSAQYCHISNRLSSTLYWTASSFLVGGLVLSGQRLGMVLIFIPVAFTLLMHRRMQASAKRLLFIGAVPILLFVSCYFLLRPLVGEASHLYQSAHAVSGDPRWNVWAHAWNMFMSAPWMGVGFSQFGAAYFDQLDVMEGGQFFTHPHNFVLALMAEAGSLGALLTLVPIFGWAWRTVLKPISSLQWFGWMQVLIIGFHSMVEFPLWYAYWLVIASFWLGAMDPSRWQVRLIAPRLIAAALVLLVAIPLMNAAFTYQKLAFTAFSYGVKNDEFLARYRAETIIEVSNHWLFEREGSSQLAANLMEVGPDHIADKIAFNEKVTKAVPGFGVLAHQVVFYVLNGDIDSAVRWLARSQKIYPDQYTTILSDVMSFAPKWPVQFSPEVIRRLKAAGR